MSCSSLTIFPWRSEEPFRLDVLRWGLDDLNLKPQEVGLRSATRVWQLYPPPPKRKGELVTGPPHQLVEHLIQKLEALSILDEEEANE
jgi:electron transfer flavoprotein alpha/beta subunit